MTLFDLLFLIGALVAIGTIFRAAYLLLRRRFRPAIRVLTRLGIGVGVYFASLIAVSIAQPGRVVPTGVPNCFDDFCIAIDGAVQRESIGSVSSDGVFVVVSGRVVSTARGRRQRETDVRGVLVDDGGKSHEVSSRGQGALRELGSAGSTLTDFVEPGGTSAFRLVFDVPKTSRTFEFVTTHGWFPGMLIIGDAQSLFHRPTIVRLPPLSAH